MSEWVHNTVVIKGAPKALTALRHQLAIPSPHWKKSVLDQETPPPFFLWNIVHPSKDLRAAYKSDLDVHCAWNYANWGTKWDAAYARLTKAAGQLEYQFSTTWCDPNEALLELSRQYPSVSICNRYYTDPIPYEYHGCAMYKGGKWRQTLKEFPQIASADIWDAIWPKSQL